MSKAIKGLSLFFALVFVLSFMIGCARQPAVQETEPQEQEQEQVEEQEPAEPEYPEPGNPELPLVTDGRVITVWGRIEAGLAAQIESLADSEYYKELERRTGITVEFIHPTAGREQEALQVLIASGDLPDIMDITFDSLPGGMDKAISDGIIYNITDNIREYAPNYYALLNSSPDIRQATVTDTGNVPGFWTIMPGEPQPAWYGGVVRKDWLDSLGLDVPATYDDWYQMLKAFRDEKGAAAPMMIGWTGFSFFDWFNAGFGVAARFYQTNNEVRFGPLEDGYKKYLEMMAKWYSEGLIDKDFATRRDFISPDSYTTTGRTGAWSDIYTLLALREMQSGDENFKVAAVPSPVLNEGDRLHLRQANTRVGMTLMVITTSAEDPVTLMKWLDYNYSPEGTLLANYGIEGETFEFGPDGKPRYTSYIYENSIPLGMYSRQPSGGFRYYWERELVPMPEVNLTAPDIWGTNNDGAFMLSVHRTLTFEEGAEFAQIMGDINTFVDEMSVKFIMGHQAFDNYEADFRQQIINMNIDRAIELEQAALDRFNAR